jgi:hypothetical protein
MRRYQAHGLSVSVTHLPIYFRQHVTLMLAFRNDVRIKSNDIGVIGAIGDEVPTQVVLFISCHYIIRKTCEALSLLSLSPVVFRSYFTNIWTLFDVFAIISTMVAVLWHDNHPDQYRQGFNAFVLGLLWMKVLGFLKGEYKIQTFVLRASSSKALLLTDFFSPHS